MRKLIRHGGFHPAYSLLMPLALLMLASACTKLTYNIENAKVAALATATDYLETQCAFPVDLLVMSAEEQEIEALAPNGRFFHVIIEVRTNGEAIGEVNIFVHDNIRFLGFPVPHNEVAGSSVRC